MKCKVNKAEEFPHGVPPEDACPSWVLGDLSIVPLFFLTIFVIPIPKHCGIEQSPSLDGLHYLEFVIWLQKASASSSDDKIMRKPSSQWVSLGNEILKIISQVPEGPQ